MTKKRTSSAPKLTIMYLRKSTDSEDKQIRSLGDQEKMLRELYEGFSPDEKRYQLKVISESRSAYHTGRQGFGEIISLADAGRVYRILVLDPTRLSRNPEDTGRLLQRLADGRIGEVTTAAGKRYNRSDSAQLFMLTLENTMSWKDSADKGVRVSIGITGKAKEGGSIGPAPVGYKNVWPRIEQGEYKEESKELILQCISSPPKQAKWAEMIALLKDV